MSTKYDTLSNTIPAREIKRRGIAAVQKVAEEGPVYVIRNDRPQFVVLPIEEYRRLISELAEARLAASERDIKARRTRKTSPKNFLTEIER